MEISLQKNFFKTAAIWLTIFALGATLFSVLIQKSSPAQAAPLTSCLDIQGKTTALVNDKLDAGALDFGYGENGAIPAWNACAEPQDDGTWKLKGWVMNTNVGWVSLFCEAGRNKNIACGSQTYGVTIDTNGELHGYAWGDATGYISFNCLEAGYCQTSNYKTVLDTSDKQATYWPVLLVKGSVTKYAWTNNVGWINMYGAKFPTDKTCDPAKGACDNDADDSDTPEDCNDADAGINPGAAEICTDGKDNNCNGLVDKVDPVCPKDDDDDKYCCMGNGAQPDLNICSIGSEPCTCDADPLSNPGAKENLATGNTCTDGKDNNCNGLVDAQDPGCIKILEQGPTEEGDIAITQPVIRGSVGVATSIDVAKGTVSQSSSVIGSGIQRESILRNIAKIKDTAVQLNTSNALDLNKDGDVFYAKGDLIINTPSGLQGNKTVIVEGGNVYINTDVDGEGHLGIIVLKTDFTKKNQGNIYIMHTVKVLKANIFADGSVFSYDTKNDIDENGEPKFLLAKPASSLKLFFVRQLVFVGSISSSNTIGGARKETPITPNGKAEAYTRQSELYDMAFLRYVLPLIQTKKDKDENPIDEIQTDEFGGKKFNKADPKTFDPTKQIMSKAGFEGIDAESRRATSILEKYGVSGAQLYNAAVYIIFTPPPTDLKGFEGAKSVQVQGGGY